MPAALSKTAKMPQPVANPSGLGAPLQGFPLIETQDLDEFSHGVTRLFGDFSFDISIDRKLPRTFGACVNHLQLGQVGIMYGRYGSQIQARFSDVQFYTQGITLTGSGEQATGSRRHVVHDNIGGVLSPSTPIGLTLGHGFEHVALLIAPDGYWYNVPAAKHLHARRHHISLAMKVYHHHHRVTYNRAHVTRCGFTCWYLHPPEHRY